MDDRVIQINSYLASGEFCRLLITFTNSLDPYQDRQNQGDQRTSQSRDLFMMNTNILGKQRSTQVKKKLVRVPHIAKNGKMQLPPTILCMFHFFHEVKAFARLFKTTLLCSSIWDTHTHTHTRTHTHTHTHTHNSESNDDEIK